MTDLVVFSYKFMQISVANLTAGNNVQVNLSSDDTGGVISWSSGDPNNQRAGIRLNSLSGMLPLSTASITNNALNFQTSSSGGGTGALQFEFDSYLAAAGVQYFNLWCIRDPSITVMGCFNNGPWVAINQSPTPFKWNA